MSEISLNNNNDNTVSNAKSANLSLMKRISGVIVSPGDTMRSLAASPRILFPFILIGATLLLYYLSRYQLYTDWMQRSTEAALVKNGQEMTAEQLDSMMKILSIVGLVTIPIGSIVGWLIPAFVIFMGVKVLKGDGSFKQYMSITGYAYIITAIYYILSFAVSFSTNELLLNTSLAVFAPAMKGTYLYGILRSLDFFVIWNYFIVAIGVKAVSGLEKSKVYTMMAIICIASILISAYSNMLV